MTRGSRYSPGGGPPLVRPAREQGFTLIEMVVVMVIIALTFMLLVPQFRARTHADLKRSALELAATIEHTFHQSAFRNETLRLSYDLEGSSYWLERFVDPAVGGDLLGAGDGGARTEDNFDQAFDAKDRGSAKQHYVMHTDILPEAVTLPHGVFITSVSTQYLEEATEGEAFTHFFPDGYAEPTVLYMADTQGGEYTLYVSPISGHVKVLQGHVEFNVEMKEKKT